MKRVIILYLFIFFLTADLFAYAQKEAFISESANNLDAKLENLTRQIVTEMTENRKRSIAVTEFVDLKGNVTDFGRFLSEELITRLYQTRRFKVIERQMLNKIIVEQKLVLTGAFDSSSVQRLGKLMGVDSICFGSVTELSQSLKVNARLISTETAEVFAVATVEIAKDESVLKLLGDGDSNTSAGNRSKPQESKKGQIVKANFFTFELKECKQSGSTVSCEFIVTNEEADSYFNVIEWETLMYDDFGNESEPGSISIAGKTGYNRLSLLVSGVRTKLGVRFDKTSPQATKISLLTLNCVTPETSNGMGGDRFKIQFRNIPLSR